MRRVWLNLLILILMTVNGFAQTSWEKDSGNPVLSGGSPGEWDESGVIATRTLFDGTTYHMWYSTLDSLEGIGYATSSDGISWTKHVANPVLEPGPEGAWDEISPGSPSVILVNSTYHMWYDAIPPNLFIGYATSPDGFTWTKHDSNPVLEPGPDGDWDDEGVFNPEVIYKDGIYHIWYPGWDGTNTRIGLATSSDGVNWTKYAGNPVMDIGSIESWDDESVGYPSVVINGTTYEMWYTGNDSMEVGNPFGAGTSGIGYATSPDGITWTRFEENPVLSSGLCCAAWDWIVAFLPDVVFDGSKYQMWYSGIGIIDGSVGFSIGYAVSLNPVITSISDFPEESSIPQQFALHANYPNPFNPTSTIQYDLPEAANVTLVIYDILGREVIRLVDRQIQPGYHRAVWDAKDHVGGAMPTGIYFARLLTPDYTKSIKMLLLR